MRHAMDEGLTRYRKLVFIGADCPALDQAYLRQALALLAAGHPVVLGPADDGGYVLLGLGTAAPGLFGDIDWGTGLVLGQTLQRVQAAGLTPGLLPSLKDIDRPEDLDYCEYS